VKKIVTVLGARPQFIKASVVSKAIGQSAELRETVIHTGQHFDANMSDVFFAELGMRAPEHHLGISGGRHGEMTGRMLVEIEKVLLKEKPEVVLVYGDTNSTLAGALAAAKLHIPVAHVEAGLRSFNTKMPEEINRVLTDRISHWLFTPTPAATKNLKKEGASPKNIFEVGDVMYDVVLKHGSVVRAEDRVLKRLGILPKSYILATVHRAENTDNPNRLRVIVEALRKVAQSIPVIWPLHPRTRQILEKSNGLPISVAHLHFIEPVGYLDMVQLEKYASVIATDSGGVQKEAFFHRVPCVTLREETEWVELVKTGWNHLAPPEKAGNLAEVLISAVGKIGRLKNFYGDGNSAKKIISILKNPFQINI
jgi:UDP-GlcNAc3NAcA epimerase